MSKEKILEYQDYIIGWVMRFQDKGINVTFEQLAAYLASYFPPTSDEEDLRPDIDDFFECLFEEKKKRIEEIPLNYQGITLNEQDIDLLFIANSKSLDELRDVFQFITGCRLEIPDSLPGGITFEKYVSSVFDLYLDQKIGKNNYFQKPSLELRKKIDYLLSSDDLTIEERKQLLNLLDSSSPTFSRLQDYFSPEQISRICHVLRDCSPVEKSGIKSSTIDMYRRLYDMILHKYNSITLDEEGKQGKIVLPNGECDFRHLEKCLKFAEGLGKTVRINTLLFYMDCPEVLYQLDKTPKNHDIVKKELLRYVDETTKVLAKYPATVRSVDVFNELLNRFPMKGDVPYQYRGDIEQGEDPSDNIKSGWLKHLSVEDLCDVIAQARKNLPHVDFMYNDDHLIDFQKVKANKQIIDKIHAYEKEHDIRLIDSIGTQMHIDYSCTREQMERMFQSLSSFELPIEITEFDLAMTDMDSKLSSEQIQEKRQKKMAEVYDVVESLRDECNIRGFTIWSKTDCQNFRVSLENKIRIENQKEPITTFYGGYYRDDMTSKGADAKTYFNYHTHTNLCGHASTFTDDQYIESAHNNGFTKLGFSDHVPSSPFELPVLTSRMRNDEASIYLDHIRKLQKQYSDMQISCGFEAEFVPTQLDYLVQLRDQVDYMILGQHFVNSGFSHVSFKDPSYPIQYAEMVCQGMDTGIFDIVAHPDLFFKYLKMVSDENREEYLQNAEKGLRMICEKSKELGIPVEVNFGALSGEEAKKGDIPYPSSMFLSIASEVGCPVMFGVDAHHPASFDSYSAWRTMTSSLYPLHIVSDSYDVVAERKKNRKLQEMYCNTKKNSFCDEAELISLYTGIVVSSLGDSSVEEISEVLQEKFGVMEDAKKVADEHIQEQLDQIDNDSKLSFQEKKFLLTRIRDSVGQTRTVVEKKNQLKKDASSFVSRLGEYDCQNGQDVVRAMKLMTEENYQKDPEKKRKAQDQLASMSIQKNVDNHSNEKGVAYQKKNANENPSHGYFSVQTGILLLIGTLLAGLFFYFILR